MYSQNENDKLLAYKYMFQDICGCFYSLKTYTVT